MRKLTLALLCVFLIAGFAYAAEETLTFEWEQTYDNSITEISKWTLYYGDQTGGPYTHPIDISNDGSGGPFTSMQVIGCPDGQETTYFFVLTATDTNGNESKYSNEISYIFDFAAPNAPTFKAIIKVVTQ